MFAIAVIRHPQLAHRTTRPEVRFTWRAVALRLKSETNAEVPFRDVFPPKFREKVRTDTWSDRGAVLVKEESRVYLETPGIIS